MGNMNFGIGCSEIQKAVKYMGFEEASPIQAKAIPVILEGKDIIGQARDRNRKDSGIRDSTFTESRSEKQKAARDCSLPDKRTRNTGGGWIFEISQNIYMN